MVDKILQTLAINIFKLRNMSNNHMNL
uniref:Uncharacterized protein n=1 Tax=Arundo donax TaxID=35708 RepID=A0A0A9A307_ARUDO